MPVCKLGVDDEAIMGLAVKAEEEDRILQRHEELLSFIANVIGFTQSQYHERLQGLPQLSPGAYAGANLK